MDNIKIDNQPILSRFLSNINLSEKKANAYLLYGNDLNMLKNYSILLSKILICPNNYTNNCSKCNICSRINKNIYNELIVIDKTSEVIKKEDVLNIRDKFNKQPIEGKYNIYVINNVENMNTSASNSILKFLEEPDSNVIAIFNTTNLDKVSKTILSRCQILKLNNEILLDNKEKLIKITNLDYEEIGFITEYFFNIENKYYLALAKIKEEILSKYQKKEQLKSVIMVGILIYKDAINYKLLKKMEYFNDEVGVKNISDMYSLNILTKKVSFLMGKLEDLDYNVNVTLFLTSVLIELGELSNDRYSGN